MKIANFKCQFTPSHLPDEVFESGIYRIGENVSQEQFSYDQKRLEAGYQGTQYMQGGQSMQAPP
jgi:hypothetical protein